MSIQRLGKDFIDVFTLVTEPSQSFTSASFTDERNNIAEGIEGAVFLMPNRIKGIKAQRSDLYSHEGDFRLFTETDTSWERVSLGRLGELLENAKSAVHDDGETSIVDYLAPTLDGGLSTIDDVDAAGGSGTDKYDNYMSRAGIARTSPHLTKSFPIKRLQQTDFFHYDYDLAKFGFVKNVLSKKYKSLYTNTSFSITNYHCLNFFTASSMDSSNVLIYNNQRGWSNRRPCKASGGRGRDGSETNDKEKLKVNPGPPYTPYTSFTYQFWINPRYTTDNGVTPGSAEFHAGTLLHISSTVAISLVTGSERDKNGQPSGYRMMLQLSHSSEIAPSKIQIKNASTRGSSLEGLPAPVGGAPWGAGAFNYPDDLIFLSPDNSLKRNHWHHVAIRWGGDQVNNGTGSFVIDGQLVSEFCIPSGSVTQLKFADQIDDGGRYEPSALFIGNFLEGTNRKQDTATQFTDDDGDTILDPEGDPVIARGQNTATFFNSASKEMENLDHRPWDGPYGGSWTGTKARYGVYASQAGAGGVMLKGQQTDNPNFSFLHPLNAEVHDIRIYETYQTLDNINETKKTGPTNFNDMLFYLPVFFVKESPMRRFVRCISSEDGRRDLGTDGKPSAVDSSFNGDLGYASVPYDVSGGGSTRRDNFRVLLYTGSDSPINIQFAKQMNAQQISLENYTREFVQGAYPRLYHLTESTCGNRVGGERLSDLNTTAFVNQYVFSVKMNNSRNFAIMPCDNGLFAPNFNLLISGTNETERVLLTTNLTTSSLRGRSDRPYARFVNDDNIVDLSMVSLRNLVDVSYPQGKEPFQTLKGEQGLYSAGGRFADLEGTDDHVNGIFSRAAVPDLRLDDFPTADFRCRAKATGRGFGQFRAGHNGYLFSTAPTMPFAHMGLSSSFHRGTSKFERASGIPNEYPPTPIILGITPHTTVVTDGETDSKRRGDALFSRTDSFNDRSLVDFPANDITDAEFSILSTYVATGDLDSNLTSIFDVSNLYYGDRIKPGTFHLTDHNFTGSHGKLKISLKDDGMGGLYRADSATPHATWNNIGNLYYDEGIAFIKSPHIYRIGRTNFRITMLGENEVHVMSIDVPCPAGQINVSHNPTFKPLKPSNDPNETATEFVYVTGIDLMDDNLNVVARANLAQPVVKRISDEFLFRIKVDF